VISLIDAGPVVLLTDRKDEAAPGDELRGAAHCPQKRAAGEFSNPHFAQPLLNEAAHCSQNFSPPGFSAPHFAQRAEVTWPLSGKTVQTRQVSAPSQRLDLGPSGHPAVDLGTRRFRPRKRAQHDRGPAVRRHRRAIRRKFSAYHR
jgi:hypothetical protein